MSLKYEDIKIGDVVNIRNNYNHRQICHCVILHYIRPRSLVNVFVIENNYVTSMFLSQEHDINLCV
jgi:hypothetical protein